MPRRDTDPATGNYLVGIVNDITLQFRQVALPVTPGAVTKGTSNTHRRRFLTRAYVSLGIYALTAGMAEGKPVVFVIVPGPGGVPYNGYLYVIDIATANVTHDAKPYTLQLPYPNAFSNEGSWPMAFTSDYDLLVPVWYAPSGIWRLFVIGSCKIVAGRSVDMGSYLPAFLCRRGHRPSTSISSRGLRVGPGSSPAVLKNVHARMGDLISLKSVLLFCGGRSHSAPEHICRRSARAGLLRDVQPLESQLQG